MRLGVMVHGKAGQRGSRYRWALPGVHPLQGTPQRLPVAPYALGAWLGNGSRHAPIITQGLGDEVVIDAIKGFGYGTSKEFEQWSSSKVYYFCPPTLYIPCRLPRKQMKRVFTQSKPVAIKSIKRVVNSKRRGHCITVDASDGLYLVGETLQPTHNSRLVHDFIAWVAGQQPDWSTIFASYSDELGVTANLRVQRVMELPFYQGAFRNTRLAQMRSALEGQRNTTVMEFSGRKGSFRATTVQGQITGHGLHLGVIDDPIKGRAEAQSKLIRDKTWSWLVDDFFSRFANHAGLIRCRAAPRP